MLVSTSPSSLDNLFKEQGAPSFEILLGSILGAILAVEDNRIRTTNCVPTHFQWQSKSVCDLRSILNLSNLGLLKDT